MVPERRSNCICIVRRWKTGISAIILDEKWRSAPAKTIASLPDIPQGNGKKAPRYTISVAMIAFVFVLAIQKKN
jgi:hypothetical protein